MNATIKAQWIEALRSGKYTQGRDALTHIVGDMEFDCCLGVLCKVLHVPRVRVEENGTACYENGTIGGERGILPSTIITRIGLDQQNPVLPLSRDKHGNPDDLGITLSNLNDDGFTFNQIADLIEYFL